jgi:hypothetical protein
MGNYFVQILGSMIQSFNPEGVIGGPVGASGALQSCLASNKISGRSDSCTMHCGCANTTTTFEHDVFGA